jgi:3-phosphoshikimate 1-carboxyvinyltransferase
MKYREIIPLRQKPNWQVALPGSKSITNRAFLCAALADGKSRIFGALKSDDSDVMLKALKKVGVKIRETKDYIEITGTGGKFIKGKKTLDLHNAGTATRFLTAIMILRDGETIITGDKRMQERPIADLIDGLNQIGASVEYLGKKGCPPLKIRNPKLETRILKEYAVSIKGDKSSQYFSALLMLGPMLSESLRIEVIGDPVSKPYIDVTLNVLKQFGIKVRNNSYRSFIVRPQSYKSGSYTVEGDASAASYWTSIACLHGGKVRFTNLTGHSYQGDARYGDVLKKCAISGANRVINMEEMPDTAMTLAVTAPFLSGQTKITGLSTLSIKETDRLAALENELQKVGVNVSTTKDSITIGSTIGSTIGPTIGSTIRTYNDHRMAMCFAVLGTIVPGIVIENPCCVYKTYPDFWKDLELAYLSPIRLGRKNLVLTGMRCSGKTRLGKKIARLLKREFVDIDDEIEKSERMRIADIISRFGWPYFRNVEQKICSLFAGQKNLVIATGGGVILSEKNMRDLKKNGLNIFIFADPSVLIERIRRESKNRPALTVKGGIDEVHDIWHDRRDLYLKYADIVWDNTSGEVVEKSLGRIFSEKMV